MAHDDAVAAPAPGKPQPTFMIGSESHRLVAAGIRRQLEPGDADGLADRVRGFFARNAESDGPGLLVGALPFDRKADDFLFQPDAVMDGPISPEALAAAMPRDWRVHQQPSRRSYEAAVARALALIAEERDERDPLSKIVLSRSLLLEADAPIDVLALVGRLGGDPGAVRFLTPIGPGADGQARHLVGATPELLLSRTGSAILSHPLAGSARRSEVGAEDQAAAAALIRSSKDRQEHRWVVEAILDSLAPYCCNLAAPKEPSLISTHTMWHLGTRIEGQLKDPEGASSAELVAALHPTPAVGGTPRDRAIALIPELEGYDRGFYAGAVGWTKRGGDGAWYVSLRCAEVSGRHARVYAGAGVVEGSTPAAEADETSAKLQAMLRALGIDEDGRSLPGEPLTASATV